MAKVLSDDTCAITTSINCGSWGPVTLVTGAGSTICHEQSDRNWSNWVILSFTIANLPGIQKRNWPCAVCWAVCCAERFLEMLKSVSSLGKNRLSYKSSLDMCGVLHAPYRFVLSHLPTVQPWATDLLKPYIISQTDCCVVARGTQCGLHTVNISMHIKTFCIYNHTWYTEARCWNRIICF